MEDILLQILDQDSDDIASFVQKYFGGDWDLFFSTILEEGIWTEDELMDWGLYEFEGPTIMYFLNNSNKDIIGKVAKEFISGVSQQEDGKLLYLVNGEDISNVFSRNSERIVESLFEGDLWDYAPDSDLDDESLGLLGLIQSLNSKNLQNLKNQLYQEVEGQEVQLGDSTDIITLDMVNSMDYDEMVDLIVESAPDLYSNLRSLYTQSVKYAWEGEVYENYMDTLRDFTQSKTPLIEISKEITKKDGTKSMVYHTYLDVTSPLSNMITEMTSDNLRWPTESPIQKAYYFWNILDETMGLLDLEIPEWADDTKVEENINEIFSDYI